MIDRACLSYWFPKLLELGVAVPDTRIVRTELALDEGLEGPMPRGFKVFLSELHAAALEVGGYPAFLRTGHGAAKHGWQQTCRVPSEVYLDRHVMRIVEWSAMTDFVGLSTNVWAMRRMLRLRSSFTAFDNFPVNIERRYFVEAGAVICHHSYWPPAAVAEGKPDDSHWKAKLTKMNVESPAEVAHLTRLSEQVARGFLGDGAWSLDWALDEDGTWIAIDMAPAERSFHWAGCTSDAPRPRE